MKRINNIFKITFLSAMITVLSACSSDDDFDVPENSSSDDIEDTLNSVSTQWGASKEEVLNRMKNYQPVENPDPEILQFQAKKTPITVIYQFFDDKLCAAVIKAKIEDNDLDINTKINGFAYIGELKEKNIYTDTEKNVFAASYTISEDDENFQIIGLTPYLPVTETVSNHDCADLGLSVKWATCNIGAEKPEDAGGYYAWGETEEKDAYSFNSYKYIDSNGSLTDIGDNICGTQYDVASELWGHSWQMPTKEQMEELLEECDWVSAVVNGVNGYKVFGKNGNYIFLPAAGYKFPYLRNYGSFGEYITGTILSSSGDNCYDLKFGSSGRDMNYALRCSGNSVRAVVK